MGVWNHITFLICLVSLFSTAAAQSVPRNVFFQYHPLNELTVSWTPPVNLDGITGYSLVYTANGNQKEVTIDGPGATTTTVQDNDLAGNPPLIVLLAPMMNGNVDGANIVRATTPTEQDQVLPPAPQDATVQRTSINSYQLTWTNTNGNSPVAIEGYVISFAPTTPTGTDFSSIEVPPDRNVEQIQGLQPDTDYTFYLYSQNNGLRSRANLTTLPPVTQDLKPPENFILYQLSLSSILLRWDPPAPPDNSFEDYVVVYLNNDNGQVLEEIQLDSTITSYVVSNLQGDISYIFRVVTQAGTARSESNGFIAKPLDLFTNIQPMVGAVTDQKIQLSWQNPNFNRNFVVHLFKDDGTQEINQTLPNLQSTTTVIQDLMSDSTYVILVEDSLTLTVLGVVQAMTNTPPNSAVTVNTKTASSVTLSWIGIPLATSYRISYISQDNTGAGVISSTTPTSVVTGLQPQMTYTFSVVATVGTSEVNEGSVTETTDTVSTMAVNATPGTNTIDLSWASIPNTVVYQIVYQPLVPVGIAIERNSFENFFTLTDLFPVTTYNITVYAITSSLGTSALVTVGTVVASTVTVLKPPENFILYQLSASSILLRWDPPSPPDNSFGNYVVVYFDSANGEAPQEIQLDSTVTSHVLSNLRGDASYIFQVVTQAGTVRSESNPFFGKALDLSSNIQLMVGAVTDQKVELSWQNPNLNRNFVVHLFKDDGTQEINQTVPNLPSITTVIQDLMSDSTYVIVIEDSLTLTVLGSVQAMTNVQPNSNVRVDSKTSTSVVLSWNLIPFATNYRISYISQDNAGTGVLSSTIPTSVVTGLQPQMTYAFSVVATVVTSRVNVGTVAVIIDATLSGSVNVSNLTPTTVSLQWTLFPGNVIYEIVYTGPDGNPTTVSSVSNGASLINLSPGTPYSIRVQVRDSTGITIIGTTSITTPVTSDTTPPAVMCPPDVNRVLESGNSVLIDVGQPIVSDNSGSVELVSSTLPAGNQFSIGTTMVTFTYRDPANNRASCSLFVLVSQVTPIIVKEVTPTTATLSWTTVPGVIAYDILFTAQNNFQRSVTSPTEWVFMANLSPGLPYNARVVANVASPGGQVEVGMTSFNTSQPNSVTVTGVTTSTAILSWDPLPGTTVFYQIIFTGPNGVIHTHTLQNNFMSLTGLSPGFAYNFRVQSAVGNTTVVIGTAAANTGPLIPRPAPRDVYFQSHELNYFTVSWTPEDITDVTGYLVAYEAGSAGFQETINDPTATTITLQDDTLGGNPPNGVLIVPFVSGMVNTQYLVQGNEAPLHVLPLEAPTSATVQRTSATSYELRWVSAPGVDGYVISYATTLTRDNTSSREVPLGRTSEQITGLPPNTDFTFYLYSQKNGLRKRAVLTMVSQGSPDTTPPTVLCPSDILRTVPLGSTFAMVAVPLPTVTDDSGIFFFVSSTVPTTNQFPLGTTSVTFTYRDLAFNQASCTLSIFVSITSTDTIPPVVSCPPDVTVTVQLGSTQSEVINVGEPTVSDNSGVVVLVNSTLPAESRFPIGTTAVDFIYRDPANNQASCSLLVSVVEVDTIPPVVICPGTFVATIPAGATSGIITLPSATANDVGGSVTLVSTQPNPTNPFPLGTTNVSYTFRDQFGNRASCSFDVVVSTGTIETGVTVTSVTENSISVSWPQVPNNLIYQILYSDSDRTQINITMTESITLTDLLEGTSYNITVVGFNNSGRVDVGSVIATTATITSLTACSSGPCKNLGTCINVQQNNYACICQEDYVGDQCELLAIVGTPFFVSDRGTDFVTVTWEDDPSQIIVSYILTLFDASGTVEVVQQQLVAPEPTLTSQFTGLQPATKYTLDVDVIVGSVRNQFVSGTFYTRPKPPENIILYTLSDEASIIRWDPPSPDNNFDGYLTAYQDISSGFISAVPLASAVRSHVFDGLQIGVAYDFTVLTTVGQNTASSFTTFPTITLGSPANVSIRAVTAEHVEVAWTVPQVYAQSYMVHLFNEGGTEEHSRTVGAENTSVVFQNLTPNTLYLAVLETVSASSKLSYVSGWDLARTNILTASTLAVAEIGSTSATLSWIPIPSATGYVVSYISQDLSDTGVVELPSPSTTATVSGLRPETIYTFSVVATSNPPTGVGTTVGVTNVLTEVVVDAVTFNTISLSWTNIPDSNFYQIDYQSLDGVVRQTASLTNTTTINGLIPSTSYNITVQSFSFGAIRQAVGFVAVSTEMASTAEIVNITVDTVVLTWDPLPGALVYIVTITDGISSNVEQTFASPITISGLTHNTMYEFSVVGYGPMGEVNLGSISGSTAFDNCASSPCQNGGECVNVLTSFTCECGLGYFGTLCEIAIQCPIPPMSNALNSFDGSCIGPGLIDNGYSCTYRCALGFLIRGEPTIACQLNGTLDGTFPLCEDVDECRNGLMCENPNSFCLNNIGSFMCSCNGGFQLMPDGTCQESATISCTPDPCANGGTCVAGFNRVTCLCRPGFTGPACEQSLFCGGVQCGSSQVCVNEQCTCLEGFILQGGLCQSPCSPQCDIETEICVSTTGGGFQCDCRPDRERSFWTGLCVPRSRTFSSVFAIDELGGSPVDFNPSFADPTSLAFQEGSDAVTGLLPLAFEAAGMPGVIGIEVGGFFQGSLMCEITVYVGKEFDGTEIDLKNVLMPNASSTRFSDGSHEILIRRDSVTVHEITHSDPCSMPELNDCSVNAVCLNEDERAYICLCMEGYKDMFPESLPGRYCMEDKTSTTPSVIDKEPGTGFDKRNIFIGIVSSVAIIILLVLIVFCFNLIRIHREEYKVKKRTAAQEKAIEVKTPEDFVQSSVPDVFFKKSNLDDHTYINPNPQLDKQLPSAFSMDSKNHATTMDELEE